MPYVGKEPVRGQNRELDDISGSFNGGNTAFTMQVGGVNTAAGSANQVFINLGGVMQNPGTDFTVASSTITFTTPPANGLSFWGLIQGDAVDIQEPADGSVTSSKIASGNLTLPGDVTIPDKIVHDGDTNTAIRFPAADTITAETAGSEQVRINSTGEVLIGTTTAGESGADDLTIENTAADMGITLRSGTSNNGQIFFSDGTSGADEYRGFVQYNHSTNNFNIGVNSVEKIRIHTDGTTSFASGIGLGNGVTYAANNTLTDYETGTFTPTIQGTGTANACTYTDQKGKYVKIGHLVFVDIKISWSAKTADTGSALVNGLPFQIQANSYGGGSFAIYSSNFTSGGSVITATTESAGGNNYFYAALVSLDNITWYNASAADMWENGTGHYRTSFTYMTDQ